MTTNKPKVWLRGRLMDAIVQELSEADRTCLEVVKLQRGAGHRFDASEWRFHRDCSGGNHVSVHLLSSFSALQADVERLVCDICDRRFCQFVFVDLASGHVHVLGVRSRLWRKLRNMGAPHDYVRTQIGNLRRQFRDEQQFAAMLNMLGVRLMSFQNFEEAYMVDVKSSRRSNVSDVEAHGLVSRLVLFTIVALLMLTIRPK